MFGCNSFFLNTGKMSVSTLSNIMLRGCILGEVMPEELENMLNAYGGWKRYTCALALHRPRVSMLGRLGVDLLKMILKQI